MSSRTINLTVVVGVGLLAGLAAFRAVRPPSSVGPGAPGAFGFVPGEMVHDFRYRSTDGQRGRLSTLLAGKAAVVLALHGGACSDADGSGAPAAEVAGHYADRGVGFATLAAERDVVGALQAGSANEVFLIDRAGTLRYRGGADTQALAAALDEVLAGRAVRVASTEAAGCPLAGAARVPERPVTYHNRVSRIVQQNCALCHRAGGVAPFSLERYDLLYAMRERVHLMVTQRRMPPWFADPAYGEWKNDRRLSDRDRRDLLAWIEAGAPAGDSVDAPLPRAWVFGWQLPEPPDTVIRIPEPMVIPAEGVLDYQYVYVKTDFPEDRWLRAAELQPTNRMATHHIIAFLESPEDTTRGPWLVGYAPGVPPAVFPQGTGKLLPKGAWIMFELHYTPHGMAGTDQAELALLFASEPPRRPIRTTFVGTEKFEIPPGAARHEVVAERTFRNGGQIFALLPHMHLRGKAFRFELVRPDGTEETLLEVPNYSFMWQLWYEPKTPIRVDSGAVLRGRAWYDNSAGNPANPDPTATVTYGKQSFEEMMFGFFEWVPDPRPRASR
jgi:mono/diheme cytochrome c family protein